jgi:23S rRNA pseudouridine2605 synthase
LQIITKFEQKFIGMKRTVQKVSPKDTGTKRVGKSRVKTTGSAKEKATTDKRVTRHSELKETTVKPRTTVVRGAKSTIAQPATEKEVKIYKPKDSTSRFKADAPAQKGFKMGEKIRLNRYLANSGVCSRREADRLIEAGTVTVNGKVVSELGAKVSLEDDVRFNGTQLNPERKVYLVLNKPKGFVTTTDDPQERKTVMDLIKNACTERIYPVGRLDRETTGILLFTNDGDIAKKLTHPSFAKKKLYHVHLDKPLTKNHLLDIAQGIVLDDGAIAADAISYANEEDKCEIGIEIHSGRNRIVRRIFEHLGYKVEKLDRVLFAGLSKKNLSRGHWRFLTPAEINLLKMM